MAQQAEIKNGFLNFLYRVVFFIEAGWLLIDAIGGYFLNKGGGSSPFNTIIRAIVLMFILCVFILDKNIKGKSLPFLLIFFFVFLSFIQYASFALSTGLGLDIIFKLVLLPIFLLLFKAQVEQGRLTQRQVNIILLFNIAIFAGNVILSYFNIGFSNYGVNSEGDFVGGTGFFYEGNECGGVLSVISCLGLYFFSKKGFFYTIVFSIIFLICSFGLLSKTALLSVFLNIVVLIALSGFNRSFAIVFLILIVAIVLQKNIAEQLDLFWGRISYFAGQQGWETVLTGGAKRHDAITLLYNMIIRDPILVFIGHGWTGYTENNFFDLLQGYGVAGMIYFLIPLIFFVMSARKISIKKDRKILLVVFNCVLIFGVSVMAGHIIQSAMNSLFLAILLNFGTYQQLAENKKS